MGEGEGIGVGGFGLYICQSFSVCDKLSKFLGKMSDIMRAEYYRDVRELLFKRGGCALLL